MDDGHSGLRGNDAVDYKAKETARRPTEDDCDPNGQHSGFTQGQQVQWNRQAVKGLAYVETDRGEEPSFAREGKRVMEFV